MRELRQFLFRWQNLLGLVMTGFIVMVAAAAPRIAPNTDLANPDPIKIIGLSRDRSPHPPSLESPLGTLPGQVDVFHSLVWGTRFALQFGLLVTLCTATFGILLGSTSAYHGGWVNSLTMRITDAFLAFPLIAGVVLFQQLLNIARGNAGLLPIAGLAGEAYGPSSWILNVFSNISPVMLAFILFSWMPYARLMNTSLLAIRGAEYAQAARALGAGHLRVLLLHLVPNAISPCVVLAARDVGGIVILQATFTFIGLGSDSVWGYLLVQGRDWIIGPGGNPLVHWWVFLPITLALVSFGIGWNLLGDGLNQLLNPRNA